MRTPRLCLILLFGLPLMAACGSDETSSPPPSSTGGATGDAGAGGGTGGDEQEAGTAGTGGSAEGGSGGGVPADACEASCAASSGAGCPNEPANCVGTCNTILGLAPWCAEVGEASSVCVAEQPSTSYVCNGAGQAELGAGLCAGERDAFFGCLFHGLAAGLPDSTANCQAMCDHQAGLGCSLPNCLTICNTSTTTGLDGQGACAGAAAVAARCAAGLSSSDFACSAEGNLITTNDACALSAGLINVCLGDFCQKNPDHALCK